MKQQRRTTQVSVMTKLGPKALRYSLALAVAMLSLGREADARVDLPSRSPAARVSQFVGITAITVDYNSPAVRGRAIWGGVVPYGQPWSGEESPSAKITFDKDVVVAGQPVRAGTYALLVFPGTQEWMVALTRDLHPLGAGREYRPDLDAARVTCHPVAAGHRERLTFLFSDFTDDRASVDLEWADLRISIPIQVRTAEQVAAGIAALDETPRAYAQLAHMMQSQRRFDLARDYLDKSNALRAPGEPPTPDLEAPGKFVPPNDPLPDSLGNPGKIGEGSTGNVRGERVAHVHGRTTKAVLRSPADVAPVVKKHRADIEACYQRALRANPALEAGALTVHVGVGVSGTVKTVSFDSPSRLEAVEPCIRAAISRWVFPLSGQEYAAEFPVNFATRN